MITSDHTLDSRLVVMPHGKPSNCTAIESYSYFDTDEPFKALSLRLGTSPNTLRKWWVEKFGKDAFDARCKRIQAKGAVRFNKTLTGATKKMKETEEPCSVCGTMVTVNLIQRAHFKRILCTACEDKERGVDCHCPVCGLGCVGAKGLTMHMSKSSNMLS